jgi:hypothetical protein
MGNTSMGIAIRLPSGLQQRWAREQIKSVLLSQDILSQIHVAGNGRIKLTKESWEDYWKDCSRWASPEFVDLLEKLKAARRIFIESRFDLAYAVEYCFWYFSLLNHVLKVIGKIEDSNSRQLLLHKILGFECLLGILVISCLRFDNHRHMTILSSCL